MPLLVVGSVALDSVETPRQRRDNVLGGSAVLLLLCRQLFHARPAGRRRGRGFSRPSIRDLLNSRGIDTSGLARRAGRQDVSLARQISAEHERPRNARSPSERLRAFRSGAARRVSPLPLSVSGQRLAGRADEGARPGAQGGAGGGRHDGSVDQHRSATSCWHCSSGSTAWCSTTAKPGC